jgi:hypothetical protein
MNTILSYKGGKHGNFKIKLKQDLGPPEMIIKLIYYIIIFRGFSRNILYATDL